MVRRDLTFFKHRTRSNTFCNMKTLLVLSAAVAAASAEADPQFLYHGYAPAAYYNSYVNPFLYPTLKKVEEPKVEKAEEEMKMETPMVYSPYLHHPYAFNYPYAHHPYAAFPYHTYAPYMPVVKAAEEEKKVEKREAEADPYLLYNTHYPVTYTHAAAAAPAVTYTYTPVTHHVPLVYTAATGCMNHMGAAVPCAYGNVVAPAVAAPVEEKKVEKREAEADPEAWWYGNYYNAYNYGHYYPYNHYSAYYAPYHYAVGGCRNNFGAVVPCA